MSTSPMRSTYVTTNRPGFHLKAWSVVELQRKRSLRTLSLSISVLYFFNLLSTKLATFRYKAFEVLPVVEYDHVTQFRGCSRNIAMWTSFIGEKSYRPICQIGGLTLSHSPSMSHLFIIYLFDSTADFDKASSYAYLAPYSTFRCWAVLFRYLTCLRSQNSVHVTNCTPC